MLIKIDNRTAEHVGARLSETIVRLPTELARRLTWDQGVMLWLLLAALAIILGAELNSELERQMARYTTAGGERPLGQRGAYAADTIGLSTDGD